MFGYGLVAGLVAGIGGCCSSNLRTHKEFRSERVSYEQFGVQASLRGTSTQYEGDWLRSSPYTLGVTFWGDAGEEDRVMLTGVKLYDVDRLVHQFDTPMTAEFKNSSLSGSYASFRFEPLDMEHKVLKLELDFEVTSGGVTKNGTVNAFMEPTYKQFSGNNYFDALMGV